MINFLYFLGSDNSGDFLLNNLNNTIYSWYNLNLIGFSELHSKYMMLPTKLYYLMSKLISSNILFILLIIVSLFIGVFFINIIFTKVFKIKNSIVFSTFYLLNITFLTILHWQPIYLYLFSFAFGPMFLYYLYRSLNENFSIKNILLLALANFLLLPGISNPAQMIIIGVFSAIIFAFAFRNKNITKEKLFALVLIVGMNLFYLFPLAYEFFQIKNIQNTAGFQIQTAQSLSVDNGNSISINFYQLLGGWGYFNSWVDGKPVIEFSKLFNWPLKIVLFIPMLLLTFLYSLKKPTKRELIFLIGFILVAILYMNINTPLGVLYEALLKVPGGFAFRSTFTKFGPVLVGLLVILLALRSEQIKNKKIIVIPLVIYLASMSLIFINGMFIRDFILQKDIKEYTELGEHLSKDSRSLVLPFPTYGSYRFRKAENGQDQWIPGEVFNNTLEGRQILSVGYGNNTITDNFLHDIQTTNEKGVFLSQNFDKNIDEIGVSNIILDKTFYDPFNQNYNYKNIEKEIIEKDFQKVFESNQFAVYKNPNYAERSVSYSSGEIKTKQINPVKYEIDFEIPEKEGQIILYQSYDNWKIYSKSHRLPLLGYLFSKNIAGDKHYLAKDYANSWTILNNDLRKFNKKDVYTDENGKTIVKAVIYYKPQSYVNLGFYLSIISLVGLLSFLGFKWRCKNEK